MLINIYEVGPRDGLQSLPSLPTKTKIELINKLSLTGIKKIEIGSFAAPSIIPQMSDIADVIKGINTSSIYSVLIPNCYYYRKFRKINEGKIGEIGVFLSASEKHNEENVGMSIDKSMKNIEKIINMAMKDGMKIRGYIATAFGYMYDDVSQTRVIDIARWYLRNNIYQISFGDTIGIADATTIKRYTKRFLEYIPADKICLHLHCKEVEWLEKVKTAYNLGIRWFDSSIGGFGGCPTDPLVGNIPTEKIAEYSNADITKIREIADWLRTKIKQS